ncbi:hypothetical protein SEA_GIBBLES_99 [Gordonia phage Gibbles]|nr:hypothetical protein SEA_GIBBLES_99 [Gordonia phage Gibbles]
MTTAVVENETVTNETVNPEAETEDNEPVDYSAFETAVAAIDSESAKDDKSDAVKAAKVAYGDLNPKSKRAARKWLKDESEKAMLDDEFAESKRLILIRKYAAVAPSKATTGRGPGAPKKTPEQRLKETFITLHRAYQLAAAKLQGNAELDFAAVQAEADTDLTPAFTYVQWIESDYEGDEPDVSPELKRAARVSLGRGPGGQGRKPKKDEDNSEAATDTDNDNEADSPE